MFVFFFLSRFSFTDIEVVNVEGHIGIFSWYFTIKNGFDLKPLMHNKILAQVHVYGNRPSNAQFSHC